MLANSKWQSLNNIKRNLVDVSCVSVWMPEKRKDSRRQKKMNGNKLFSMLNYRFTWFSNSFRIIFVCDVRNGCSSVDEMWVSVDDIVISSIIKSSLLFLRWRKHWIRLDKVRLQWFRFKATDGTNETKNILKFSHFLFHFSLRQRSGTRETRGKRKKCHVVIGHGKSSLLSGKIMHLRKHFVRKTRQTKSENKRSA